MISSSSPLLKHLNQQQSYAVRKTDGPMLILAGAGSGKTRTITFKIAYLIEQDLCPAERILAVTFTNKAASEMRERVQDLLEGQTVSPLISTFHSFCVRVLRRYADRLGYENDFTICDTDDQKALFKRVCSDLDVSREDDLTVKRVQSVVSWAKNRSWGPKEYLTHSRDIDAPLIAEAFEAYQRALKRSNAMDFDDLILQAVRLYDQFSEIRERTSSWYRYLLIDEYQDTNAPQYDLVRHLSSEHGNVSAVGDEDQSIYGFRGADIGNILRFEKDFPGAEVVKLEQNYRSTQVILEAATAVVSNNEKRKGKVLWTEQAGGDPIELYGAEDARAEAEFVSEMIGRLLLDGTGNVGVLYRANFQSRQFEDALRSRDIPYKLVGGVSFYSRKEVKDALAYLRTARNPRDDVSLLRIINEPARGIGAATLERLAKLAAQDSLSAWDAIVKALKERVFPGRTHNALQKFHDLIEVCRERIALPLHLALEKILEESGYTAHLRGQESEEAENRLLNLEELGNVAREYAGAGRTLQEFLDSSALHSDTDEYDASARVTLMTLHNAKGLEFSAVFLAGLEDGLFPHSRCLADPDLLEEERRLCYVGITRARQNLFLSYSRRRRFWGRGSDAGEVLHSRFLNEIPSSLVRVREQPRPVQSSFLPWKGPKQRNSYAGKTYNSKESVGRFLENLSSKKAGSRKSTAFEPGDLIEHDDFGRGKVLAVENFNGDLKVTVRFPGLGIKKLLQSYAKLRRI